MQLVEWVPWALCLWEYQYLTAHQDKDLSGFSAALIAQSGNIESEAADRRVDVARWQGGYSIARGRPNLRLSPLHSRTMFHHQFTLPDHAICKQQDPPKDIVPVDPEIWYSLPRRNWLGKLQRKGEDHGILENTRRTIADIKTLLKSVSFRQGDSSLKDGQHEA